MKSKKKLLLLGVGAMGALALGVGATSTFAWYQVDSHAKVNLVANSGVITSSSTSLSIENTYTVNFTINSSAVAVELSHLGEGAADYINGDSGATYASGTLYRGSYIAESSMVRAEALTAGTIGNCVKAYTITAAFATDPTDEFDISYLSGKKFTINISASGNAKLVASNTAFSGLTAANASATATTAVCTINANMSITVGDPELKYARIEPAQLHNAEDGTAHDTEDTIAVAAGTNVTLS